MAMNQTKGSVWNPSIRWSNAADDAPKTIMPIIIAETVSTNSIKIATFHTFPGDRRSLPSYHTGNRPA